MTPCKLQRDKEEYSLIMLSNPIEDALLDKSRCYFKRVWFQNCQHIKTKKTTEHNCFYRLRHRLQTLREDIAFTTQPKIQSQFNILRYDWSIFFLPHWPNFWDDFWHRKFTLKVQNCHFLAYCHQMEIHNLVISFD